MLFSEYQSAARKTALYKDTLYPILGLVGEIGEFYRAVLSTENIEDITKEAGDVCWYVANIATDNGITLTEDSVLSEYGYLDDGLIIHAGTIAEMVKKFIRDGKPIDIDILSKALHGILSCLDEQVSLPECMDKNIVKLQDRMNRGVIKGDGDNR